MNVSPAAKSLVDYVKQAMVHLTSPAYHSDPTSTDTASIPDPKNVNPNEMSFLCSSVILAPSRTDVSLIDLFKMTLNRSILFGDVGVADLMVIGPTQH